MESKFELLRISDLMRLLKLSRPSIYKLIRKQVLPPPLKLGRSSRWNRADIEKIFAK